MGNIAISNQVPNTVGAIYSIDTYDHFAFLNWKLYVINNVYASIGRFLGNIFSSCIAPITIAQARPFFGPCHWNLKQL